MKISKLISFDILERPANVASFAKKIIIIRILGSAIPDILSFALKGAELSLKHNIIWLAVILLLLYFGDRTLGSLYTTFGELQDDQFKQLTTSESTKTILNLCNITKSKVFKNINGNLTMVEQPELIQKSSDYLTDYWDLQLRFPIFIAQIAILIFTLSVSIVIELMTSTLVEAVLTTVMLISSIILYFILTKKRIKVMKKFRKVKKENKSKVEVLKTEIKTTDFISEKDFTFHAETLRTVLDESIVTEKDERLKLNKVFIKRSLISSLLMFTIIGIKFYVNRSFTIESFISVIALSSIYSTILNRITSITGSFEVVMNIVVDMESLYDDFKNINSVYENEIKKEVVSTAIDSVTVAEFSASQDPNGTFSLINTNTISISSGDTYLVHGHTGCGKSTLLYLLTGKLSLKDNPITFSNGRSGYLNSIAYQTDKAMANNFVINELTLTYNLEEVDSNKLFEILKGLHMFEEILKMTKNTELDKSSLSDESKVFKFIQTRKTKEFSSGQIQRLALSKLLYSLDDTIQLVALDEPFNRLDDNTAEACMKFTKNFIMRNNRILIVATHQVEICRPYANHEIYFEEDVNKSYIKFNS